MPRPQMIMWCNSPIPAQQDVVFTSRPFTLCNLPLRPIKNCTVYERRNGNFFLRLEAGHGKDLPYGRDRLVLIALATAAVKQQSRVRLGSATDILHLFGRTQSGTHYRKLTESFDRIFSATIYWGMQEGCRTDDSSSSTKCQCSTMYACGIAT